jgi:hypothetical protein
MINFYRRFIPGAAKVQAPLNDHLQGNVKGRMPVTWNPAANAAFEQCKDALAQATLLAHPKPDAPSPSSLTPRTMPSVPCCNSTSMALGSRSSFSRPNLAPLNASTARSTASSWRSTGRLSTHGTWFRPGSFAFTPTTSPSPLHSP